MIVRTSLSHQTATPGTTIGAPGTTIRLAGKKPGDAFFGSLKLTLPVGEASFQQGRHCFIGPNSQELSQYSGPKDWDKGITVSQIGDQYATADKNTPILTHGMLSCAAVVITGPKGHYMGHLTSQSKNIPDHYRQQIQTIAGSPQAVDKVYLLPGKGHFTMDTVNHILADLNTVDPGLLSKVQFVHYPDALTHPTVVAHNGNVFFADTDKELFKAGGALVNPARDRGGKEQKTLEAWQAHQNRQPGVPQPPVSSGQIDAWFDAFREPSAWERLLKPQKPQ